VNNQFLKRIFSLVLATGLVFAASAASQPKKPGVAAAFHEITIQAEPGAIVWIHRQNRVA